MRIVLVSPRNPESFWTLDRILPSLRKKCVFPNLALPTLAALTPHGHDVVLCDENVERIDFDIEADIVGITGYAVHKPRMLELAREFRRRGRLVVAGGPFVSLCPEQLRASVDVLFVGEAEHTWPQFVRDVESGRWRTEYEASLKPPMCDSPLPRFDLLETGQYRTMTIQFARGCPFSCEFCDIVVLYGRRPRTKSVEQVMAEVCEIHRLGAPNIFVVDDNFIGNKRVAKDLLRALARWQRDHDYPIEFMTEVSLNIAQDDELLALMRAANFTTIFVGIESPRAASLEETGKMQNLREDLLDAIHRIQHAGIDVMAGMIVGFDNDDASIFEEQFQFIERARIPISMTGMLNAVPRTPLYERLKRAGRLITDGTGDQFVFSNIVPKSMTRAQFYEGYKRLLERLYGYRNYRRRAMRLLLARGSFTRERVVAGAHDLGIFLRVLRDCILRASPRRALMTVRLLGETALRRPRAFRDAVTLALVHKHFYEYMRETCRRLGDLADTLRHAPDPPANPADASPGEP